MIKYKYSINILLVFMIIFSFSCGSNIRTAPIRSAHVLIRDALIRSDDVISQYLEMASEQIIADLQSRGLSGHEAYDIWLSRMELWFRLDVNVENARDMVSNLEALYDDIDNGSINIDIINRLIVQLIESTNGIIYLADILNVPIPGTLVNSIDELCRVVHCED